MPVTNKVIAEPFGIGLCASFGADIPVGAFTATKNTTTATRNIFLYMYDRIRLSTCDSF